MGLYFPQQLAWLGYIAGNAWPEEDEDDYWALADDWAAARDSIRALLPHGSAHSNLGTAKDAVAQAYTSGEGRQSILDAFDALAAGDGSLADLADRMSLIVDAANGTGSKIRSLKIMIYESLLLLAWELESSALFPPAAPLADAEDVGATRIYLQWIAREARLEIERLVEPLADVFRAGKRLLNRIVEPVTDFVERAGGAVYDAIENAAGSAVAKVVSYYPKLAWEKAPATMRFVGAQDIIAQADPVLEGRSGFDYEELGATLLATVAGTTIAAIPAGNFAGAAADRLLGRFGADTSRGLVGGVRGALAGAVGNEASTVLSNVVFDLVTTGNVRPGDWSAQGLVGGFSRSMLTGFTRGSIGELGADPDMTGPQPGSRTTRTADGDLVTKTLDEAGRTVTTTTSTDPEGRLVTRTVGADGSVTTRTTDGVEETRRAGSVTTTAEGRTRTTAADGSVTVTAPDGTRTTERMSATMVSAPTGDVTTTVGDRTTVRELDGTITTTHNDAGAITVTRTTADGYTTTAHPDGSYTLTDPTGRTRTETSQGIETPNSTGHLTHNTDEPHNPDLSHNEALAHDESQARRDEMWRSLQQQRLQPARDSLAAHQQAQTDELTRTHEEQLRTVEPGQRDELIARQHAETDELSRHHQAERDALDQRQSRTVHMTTPAQGSAMRAKKRPKEVPLQYHWPDGTIPVHRTPTFLSDGQQPHPRPQPPVTPAPQHYTVESGDNLTTIAAVYETDWQTLYYENRTVIGADPNLIRPGEILTVPAKKHATSQTPDSHPTPWSHPRPARTPWQRN